MTTTLPHKPIPGGANVLLVAKAEDKAVFGPKIAAFHSETHRFQCGTEVLPNKEDNRKWQVILKLQHQPPAEANVPYRFAVAIVGFFLVHPRYAEENIERLVRTNGPSM